MRGGERMIYDAISNVGRYNIPMLVEMLSFLKSCCAKDIPPGEIEIRGRELFVRSAQYMTRPAQEGRFEIHRSYIDFQYVVAGAEIMQFAPADNLTVATSYDSGADCQFFTAQTGITDVVVREGDFIVYFPGEAHRPMCQRGNGPEIVRKLVFKIRATCA